MKCTQAELVAAKTAIRRRHGCDSYYVGSYEGTNAAEAPVVHEFILDDAASTAYVWCRYVGPTSPGTVGD